MRDSELKVGTHAVLASGSVCFEAEDGSFSVVANEVEFVFKIVLGDRPEVQASRGLDARRSVITLEASDKESSFSYGFDGITAVPGKRVNIRVYLTITHPAQNIRMFTLTYTILDSSDR